MNGSARIRTQRWPLASVVALGVVACELPAPQYRYGVALGDVRLQLIDENEGVYPNTSVLLDPNNPFAADGVDDPTRWIIQDAGFWPASFYSWATALAERPSGENQLYTALAAQQLYERRAADNGLLFPIRAIALSGFQAVLDQFPDDVTYDATGTIAYPVAPTAYAGIEALGGTPVGWVLVEGDDGSVALVRTPGHGAGDTGDSP